MCLGILGKQSRLMGGSTWRKEAHYGILGSEMNNCALPQVPYHTIQQEGPSALHSHLGVREYELVGIGAVGSFQVMLQYWDCDRSEIFVAKTMVHNKALSLESEEYRHSTASVERAYLPC